MAQAQLIQGTGEELIAYLEKRREQKNLLLIVPEDEGHDQHEMSYPENAVIRNGVPLFPTVTHSQVVTMQKVQDLMEEEN